MDFVIGDERISADEMVRLAAVHPDLFNTTFFPKTFRQPSAPFHKEMDAAMDDPNIRYLLLEAFRGSSKTTRSRVFTAKRIAYGISKTILYVGANQDHAARSLTWLRNQIERNKVFAQTFHLEPGRKWNDTEVEIVNNITGDTAWVVGGGITGSIRGINFDDYRPDLILLDDVLTDENAATLEQREKIANLIFGAVVGSLAPASEEPNAKVVMDQTPINVDDVTGRVKNNSLWTCLKFPCWTPETIDLPVDQQESVWPERWSSEELREEKKAAAAANNLSTWIREYECKLISPEKASFRQEWIKTVDIMPQHSYKILAIDPVPPPTQNQLAKGLHGKDYEAISVVGRNGEDYFLYDYRTMRGHDPNWTIATMFELALKHGVLEIGVESVAYQAVLRWLIEQAMVERGQYWPIFESNSRIKKYNRITGALAGPLSHGHFYCRPDHEEFMQQVIEFGTRDIHDDLIDSVSIAMERLASPQFTLSPGDFFSEDTTRKYSRMGCP